MKKYRKIVSAVMIMAFLFGSLPAIAATNNTPQTDQTCTVTQTSDTQTLTAPATTTEKVKQDWKKLETWKKFVISTILVTAIAVLISNPEDGRCEHCNGHN